VPKSPKRPGRPNTIARELFGVPWGKMEPRDRRQEVALVLNLSPDQRMRFLAQHALDPVFDRTSFATLCDKFNVSYVQVAKAYKELKHSEGLLRAADHLPEIMEQVAQDAKGKTQACPKCNGKTEEGKVCPACSGSGTVYVAAEVERLRLLFDMVEPRQKGPSVNIDLRNTDKTEKLSDLYATVDGIVEGGTGGNDGNS
jgi:hypothetical protein